MFWKLLLLLGFFAHPALLCLRGDEVPIAPIAPLTQEDGQVLYVFKSEALEMRLSPDAATLLSLRLPNGTELLPRPLPLPSHTVAVSSESSPWESRGWKNSDGSQTVMLSRRLSPPHSLALHHVIQLSPSGTQLSLSTRITALAPSSERRISFQTEIPLPAELPLWLHDPAHPSCDGWEPRQPPFTSSTPALAYIHGPHLVLWRWRLASDLSSPAFPATATLLAANENAPRVTFNSLPPELPPQGWTLVSELRLDILPLPESETPCLLLKSLPSADGE